MAVDINESGHIVGNSVTGENRYHAFLWRSGNGMTDLGPFTAKAINDDGVIVGSADRQAVILRDGTLTNLNQLVGGERVWDLWEARDISNTGIVVGIGNMGVFLLRPM